MGGRAAFREAASFLVEGRIESSSQPGITTTFKLRVDAEGHYRAVYEHPQHGVFHEGYDGTVAWRNHGTLGSGIIPKAHLNERSYWDDLYLPLRYQEMFPIRLDHPDEQHQGQWFNVFEMRTPEGRQEFWYQDYQSGLVHLRVRPGSAEEPRIMMILEQYRAVNGQLKIPHKVTTVIGEHSTTAFRDRIVVAPPMKRRDPSPPAEVRAEALAIDDVLERYIQATGGNVATNVKSRVSTGRIESAGSTSSLRITQMSPFFILREMETPGVGRRLEGFDGTTGWQYDDMQGYRELRGGELMALIGSANLVAEGRLKEQFPFAKYVETGEVNGVRALRLQLSTWAGPAGFYWFDAENGHMLRLEAMTAAGASGAVAVKMDFSNFRTIDGVVYPFVTRTWNSAIEATTVLEHVEHNVTLDPAIFAPRKDG